VSPYPNEQYWSDEAQNDIKRHIATLLCENNLLLITGAGFSNNFGYPIWNKFLDFLNKQIGNPIDKTSPQCQTDGSLDYLKYAQEIANKYLEDPSRSNDIKNYIFECFNSDKFSVSSDFYKNLLELGFRGFATLNYDCALELLINRYGLTNRPSNSVNVCGDYSSIEIKKFLDNVSEKKDVFYNILHLHGIYREYGKIILTQASYDDWYNRGSLTNIEKLTNEIIERIISQNDPVTERKITELMSQIKFMFDSKTLNSQHKKLIWLIFARHQILFIGFSADDTYFMNLLEVVKDDFTLPSKPVHFVLTKFSPNEPDIENCEKELICEKLIKKGLWPIFYPVENNEYEKGLEEFVREIEALKQRICKDKNVSLQDNKQKISPDPARSIKDITRDMLRRK
jgi:ribosomal protein S13